MCQGSRKKKLCRNTYQYNYPDTVLLQESIKKDFDEVNNKVMADSKNVYTYYYKDQQSGLMVKYGIESTEIKIVDRDLKALNNL